MADLEDDGLLAIKRLELKEYDDLSRFNLPLFEIWPCSREVKKKCAVSALIRPHPFIYNGKVSSHNTRIVKPRIETHHQKSDNVSLFAMSGETYSVVKLSLLL